MELNLNLLRCFEAVASQGSVSRASERLHLSQPAISLQIRKLEDQVGKKLFDRHNRGLTLTKFGVRFLERARDLLRLQAELNSLIAETESEPAGRVRVGTYTTASSYLFAETAAKFLEQNQKVSLSYVYEDSRTILEKVKSLTLDCAILSDVPEDKNLSLETICEDELVFAVAKNQYRNRSLKLQPRDIASFSFLSYPLRYELCYRKVEAKFGAHLSKCRVALETESFDTIKQMLLKGAGATFIPRYLIANELSAGKLVALEVGHGHIPIKFSFVTKREASLPLAVQKFREAILEKSRKRRDGCRTIFGSAVAPSIRQRL